MKRKHKSYHLIALLSGMLIGNFLGIYVSIIFVGIILKTLQPVQVISPLSDNQSQVYASESKSQVELITDEIIKVFQPEGRDTVVWALGCFISESKLNPNAIAIDAKGSKDRGVSQISEMYHPEVTDLMAFNYKENILQALRIYKIEGKGAWHGKFCN